MKSFIQEIEKKFIELEEESVDIDNESDLEEQNVTGAIAGYNVPGAFTTATKFKKKKFTWAGGQVNESVNTPATYKIGEHQKPESSEEEFNDKFPFSSDDNDWFHGKFTYPSVDMSDTPGTATAKDTTQRTGNIPQHNTYKQVSKHTLRVEDIIEKKYTQLIEGYKDFKSGDVKPSSKVKSTIQEIAKKLQEIETLVNYNSKLKEESGVTSTAYGPGTQKALTKISERLLKISERVRSLGA